jgi:hypothetical protein
MIINSQTCYFKLDISSNINTYYPYNLLGFTSSTLPDTFYNTITGSNDINLNTPIFESNIFQLDILKTSSDETFQIYQPNFVIQNLCQLIQDKLIINTNLSWKVDYDNVSNRVTITLISTNNFTFDIGSSPFSLPVYAFRFIWTDSRMVHIANALGFTEQSVFSNNSIIAINPPLIDTIISNNDIIVLNTEKTNYSENTNIINFSPGTSNANQFINTLADQLSKETNMTVIVTINNNDNKMTITFVPKNINFYIIKILFSDQNMLNIANVMGFATTDIETIANLSISGIYPLDYSRILLPTDLFKIIINEISFDTKSYQFYEIPLNLPIYNPTICIDQISTKLSDKTGKPWSISSNIGSTIDNNSYLKMNLYDADTSFRMLWGNINTGNISKSMGFSNVDTTDFVNTVISGNIIDFNYNLNYTDQLNYEIKSNVYYKLDDFIIPTSKDEQKLNEYILNLPRELQNKSGKQYSVYFQESTQKTYISVSDTNITFKILFGHPSMKNIAKMLGFNPINTPKYVNSMISDNIVDYTIKLNLEEDIFFIIQKSNNYDFSTLNTISFNQSYFSSNTFINNLQDILTTKTNKTWTVYQSSNYLTIQIHSPNCAFQFLWGDDSMKDVSTALGFDTVNPTTLLTTTTSTNNINTLIQFNSNDKFIFKFRDTTQTYSIPKSYLYNVPNNMYNSQKFIKSLALVLYNLTNKIFEVIYDTNTQKITIQIDSSNSYFKIQWQLPSMSLIGQMMGFNNTETLDYTTRTTGQNLSKLYIQLNNSSAFSISIEEKTNINYDSSINKYMLNIDPNFFYPDYFFNIWLI